MISVPNIFRFLKGLTLLIIYLGVLSCGSKPNNKTHLFYLHGKIVQEQGIDAFSEKFGKYEYSEIIDSLSIIGDYVHAEIRKPSTQFDKFCIHISQQIDSLIAHKVEPKDIYLIGASMGGVMAMQISTLNTNPVNYILLGANNESIENELNFDLHGRVLGIYEKSDSICNRNYQYWIDHCEKVIEFNQLQINSGLGHGFLYRPIQEWLIPIKKMVRENKVS